MNPRRAAPGKQMPGDTGPVTMKPAPQTLAEALNVIRTMHDELLAFRHPEFDLIAPGREGEFDDRVKTVLAHSAPVINADRAAALPEASSSAKSQSQGLSFGDALKALKAGQRVARAGWNGKGMWLWIPEPLDEFCTKVFACGDDAFEAAPWIGMKTADDKFVPWLASQTDVLAEDWEVLA